MAEQLERYRAKRDFKRTPEPTAAKRGGRSEQGRFVIQEHHARRLHWDLRLERDGVLASWALPRGLPPTPGRNHLAVHTEDHPLEYLDFQGEIPPGNYGAGRMQIWDQGTYVCHRFEPRKVVVTLEGTRMRGTFALFPISEKDWLIHRMDRHLPAEASPMPARISPMLARAGELPKHDDAFGYEIKWDGVRALAFLNHPSASSSLRLQSRNLHDITAQYPEVSALADAVGERKMVLDGEIVMLTEEGLPSFERLQGRMNLSNPRDIQRMMKSQRVTYMIFDLLYLDERLLVGLPYRERRRLLEDLRLQGNCWQTPGFHVGEGHAFRELSRARGLEGIIAKRLDSPYEPGKRARTWIKIKNICAQEFVVAGWLPGAGRRSGGIGALLLGVYDHADDNGAPRRKGATGTLPQRLRYAGNVGTGFSDADLDRLQQLLRPLVRERSPFSLGKPPRNAIFVEPRWVAEVTFTEWTGGNILRHPVYKGLRADKDARQVVREPQPHCSAGSSTEE